MSREPELRPTSFDPKQLKESLIEYLQTKEEFSDFNYEGSALNTIVDLLVRDSYYSAFLANMLANESFLSTAQIRGNIVSHAQKLSYTPKSRTASRMNVDLDVIPSTEVTSFVLTAQPGLTFIGTSAGESYTFTTIDSFTLSYSESEGRFKGIDVDLYQGQYVTNTFIYNEDRIQIPNKNIDTSTIKVSVDDQVILNYIKADSIVQLGPNESVYFLRENTRGYFEVEFGKGVLGNEPSNGSRILISYVNTEETHINGNVNLVSASSIDGYSNIVITPNTQSFGGSDREDSESIKFNAPKRYQNQDRALATYDYEQIVKSRFTFIDSVKSWGGEDNDPPRYGSVYVSVLPQQGLVLTRTLKSRIETSLRERGVGSVTPIVVEPNIFNANLHINYKYNPVLTNQSKKSVESSILNIVADYGKTLRTYNRYYNESKLITDILNQRYIETAIIDETLDIRVSINRFIDTYYNVNYLNPVKEGSFKITGFSTSTSVSSERIFDKDGEVIHEWTQSGAKTSQSIGTIDYETGSVSLYATFIQSDDRVVFECKPRDENIYMRTNNIIQLGNVSLTEIQNG